MARKSPGEAEAGEKEDYHGTPLFPLEWEVLMTLEETVGRPLPILGNIDGYTFGYIASEGHVTHLCIPKEKLTHLPDSIGNLHFLLYLALGLNEITAIPETIGQLNSLEVLGLDVNKLESLPETIGQLTSLKNFSLSIGCCTIIFTPLTMALRDV